MLKDCDIVPQCIVTPGSFGGLMALYESNFIKLAHLLGDPDQIADFCLSTSADDCDLHLTLDASTKYTRDLRLSYMFEEDSGAVVQPDLSIRIYLDARLTEVLGWADLHRHNMLQDLAQKFVRELDRRWSRNMMLSKWLDYLLDKGHSFDRVDQSMRVETFEIS